MIEGNDPAKLLKSMELDLAVLLIREPIAGFIKSESELSCNLGLRTELILGAAANKLVNFNAMECIPYYLFLTSIV
ncbi:hypothetical protein D7V32_13900 [Acinetobacter tianfuensis]|uniref:Uncharacterized protein n=1 Tax=Acinetobacter tianfuensis TaxID=2419603 RepID=A0A3A8E4U1_9GAMM|nr:hypothetical protein D7V32_13900 [Acinetobacter tianfuensis]